MRSARSHGDALCTCLASPLFDPSRGITVWWRRLLVTVARISLSLLVAHPVFSCAPASSSPLSPNIEYGRASWYGDTFCGRRTASGEIYDMSKLTAAHKSAPFGIHAIVTDLDTGRSVRIRINDRGPFVKGRILDLSHAAARQLGMLEAGVARVKVEFLPATLPQSSFIVQAGVYRYPRNAAQVQHALDQRYAKVWISKTGRGTQPLYRVRLGPFPSRTQAEQVARQVRALGYASAVMPRP